MIEVSPYSENKKGSLFVVGLGPGDADMILPKVAKVISSATDIVGYGPYVDRIKPRSNLTIHSSDNRVELERARLALELALDGKKNVVVVSSGDPSVFAMASAVFEVIENGPTEFFEINVTVLPGVTAMLAASAAVGAFLGHDFCTINLSDNLKPWDVIEKRLRLAIQGDFAIALYNPRSKARPDGFKKTLSILIDEGVGDRLIAFARDVSLPTQNLSSMKIVDATPEMADMRTVVLVGSSYTRKIKRDGVENFYIYTPRYYGE
tara:strand:- start:7026 stop:7817 length:792 start_codon:yes stop_codon:yes gene_type:complete